MADRRVTKSRKNSEGDITALCNTGEVWSPRRKQDVIFDIETGAHTYHVLWSDLVKTSIRVVHGASGKYLRTDKDNSVRNNLDNLPDC
jgi:hypothetical protein